VRPKLSIAVHVTVVEPIANVLPDGGSHVVVAVVPAPPSVVTEYVTTPPLELVAVAVTVVVGAVIVGGGATLTTKLVVAVLFWASIDVHVTVVEPTANVLPEGGEQVVVVVPPTMSIADTL
jgi:hypothetical protein